MRRSVLDALFGLGGLQPLLVDRTSRTSTSTCLTRCSSATRTAAAPAFGPVAGSDAELVDLVRRLAARSGVQERRFDPGAPVLNLQLPDGSRLFAVMSVSARPSIAIRRHRHRYRYRRVTLTDVMAMGTLDTRLCALLGAAVRARLNIVIAGGPGVGHVVDRIGVTQRRPIPSCFAVFVDHVPAAAQAARTARVSCGVACSGHGPRNLAAMMTRRSLMAMSS